jgi:hypothetical protein
MDESESPDCSKIADDVTRYAWVDLGKESRAAVEAHLKQCASCGELVSFVTELTAAARKNPEPDLPGQAHPHPSLIVDLEADKLDEQDARRVSLHLLDCKPCREAYLRLRSLSEERIEEKVLGGALEPPERVPGWTTIILRVVQGALESLSVTGPGTLLQPAYAGVSRGERAAPSDRIRFEDTIVDPKTGAASKVQMEIKADPGAETVSLLLEAAPARPDWKLYLFDAGER